MSTAAEAPYERKTKGQVSTPEPIARFLVDWAVTTPQERVMDMGAGQGIFLRVAWQRLREMGATAPGELLYGVEKDPQTVADCRKQLGDLGIEIRNLLCGDFLDLSLPRFGAVIGNPPYVRRMFLEDQTVMRLAGSAGGRRLADLYCYFLLQAMDLLAEGGRLAVIVSASWLDMDYGVELKRRLTRQFSIRLLLGFAGQVFPDALVKPVLLLAERRRPEPGARLKVGLWPADFPLEDLGSLETLNGRLHEIGQAELSPSVPWSPALRAPHVEKLIKDLPLAWLGSMAETRIGLQTFAKSFYIISKSTAEGLGVEKEFLVPLAASPKDFCSPILRSEHIRHYVFYCSLPKKRLVGTQALRYVVSAEEQAVLVRGKNRSVLGYANAPRLSRAARRPWYNIQTEIDRRGRWPIFLPRRIFGRYFALANRCCAVANEDFLEIHPWNARHAPLILAWLNSSWGELLLRQSAHLYGGGVFNLSPGRLPSLRVPNFQVLSREAKQDILLAWRQFARNPFGNSPHHDTRQSLDDVIGAALGADKGIESRMLDTVARLQALSRDAARGYGHPGESQD